MNNGRNNFIDIAKGVAIFLMLWGHCIQYCMANSGMSFLENANATPDKLNQFFGKIEEIYFNGYSNDINYTILSDNKYRNFTFKITNNKISDIEENPL